MPQLPPTFVRSTYAQIPVSNRDSMLDILQNHFILPRPRYKGWDKGTMGSLLLQGGGELRAWTCLQETIREYAEDESEDPGTDPSQDDFDYANYGESFPVDALWPQFAKLLEPGTTWEVFYMVGNVPHWWTMQHVVMANIRGTGKFSLRTQIVPVPRFPIVVEVQGGLVANVYTDHAGPLVTVDWDKIDDEQEDASLEEAKPLSALKEERARPHVLECLERNEAPHESCL